MKLFKSKADARKNIEKHEPVVLSLAQLTLVSGGDTKQTVPVASNIGSVSSGLGAGKITFNPF